MRLVFGLACLSGCLLCGCGPTLDISDKILEPDPVITKTPADIGYPYDIVNIPVAPGRSVTIWHVRSSESKALVVVVPGSADNKSTYLHGLPMLVDNGYDAILMDYEGFGDSPGEASLQNAAEDALAVVGYAMPLHTRVIVYGISLGTPLATRAAAQYNAAALALDSVLVMRDRVNQWLRQYPLPGLLFGGEGLLAQVPEDYDILKYIAQVPAPKLIMHSPDDTLIPIAEAQEVYQAAPWPKTFWQEYGDHGEMSYLLPDTYHRTVVAWLDSVTPAVNGAP